MRFSQRVQSLPPYLFAGIERKIAERHAQNETDERAQRSGGAQQIGGAR